MNRDSQCDLVVVGGGVIGASVAYHSARKGLRTVVLERGEPLGGTTGATFAWLGAHFKKPARYNLLSQEAIALYAGLEAELEADLEYAALGSVILVRSEAEMDRWRQEIDGLREQGFRLEVWDGARLRGHEPIVPASFAGGIHCPVDVEVNPFRLVTAYLAAARRLGAEVHHGIRVTGLEREAGRVSAVVTEHGTWRAGRVVCAAGIDSDRIGGMLGMEVPIVKVKGQVLVSERRPRMVNSFLALTTAVEDGGFMLKQVRSGNLVIGYTQEDGIADHASTWQGIVSVGRNAVSGLPALRDVNVIRAFAGVRVVPRDSLPIISEVPGWPGVVVLAMHSGLTLSVLVGRVVAGHLTGEDRGALFQEFGLARFGTPIQAKVTAFGGMA
jgi:sarcosine oxidase subunit beta